MKEGVYWWNKVLWGALGDEVERFAFEKSCIIVPSDAEERENDSSRDTEKCWWWGEAELTKLGLNG